MTNKNEYMKEYREKNREKLREYNRHYNQLWRKKNGYHNEAKWQKSHRMEVNAEQLLRYAVKTGKIKKLPCAICDANNTVGHHPSYDKPLSVIFLCHIHHRQYHYRVNKPIKVVKQ